MNEDLGRDGAELGGGGEAGLGGCEEEGKDGEAEGGVAGEFARFKTADETADAGEDECDGECHGDADGALPAEDGGDDHHERYGDPGGEDPLQDGKVFFELGAADGEEAHQGGTKKRKETVMTKSVWMSHEMR